VDVTLMDVAPISSEAELIVTSRQAGSDWSKSWKFSRRLVGKQLLYWRTVRVAQI